VPKNTGLSNANEKMHDYEGKKIVKNLRLSKKAAFLASAVPLSSVIFSDKSSMTSAAYTVSACQTGSCIASRIV